MAGDARVADAVDHGRGRSGHAGLAPEHWTAGGPGDIAVAHAVDEFVAVDELVRAAQVLAVAAMRFCGLAP